MGTFIPKRYAMLCLNDIVSGGRYLFDMGNSAMTSNKLRHTPRISVIMAAYNRERFIAEAMGSVLGQKFDDLELIVVDDGSVDGTPDIIADFARRDERIVAMRQNNAGVAAARNMGLSRARGEYVAIADSDDISLPDRLRLQVGYLDDHSGVCGVGCRYFFIDSLGKRIGPRRYSQDPDAEPMALPTEPAIIQQKLLEKGVVYFLHGTAAFRTQTIRDVGGYRSVFRVAEDSDLHLRLLTSGQELGNLAELLVYYRQSSDNLSAVSLDVLIYRLAALAAAHRRLLGLDEFVDVRKEAFNYKFLMILMEPVGLTVWLEWIGVLQYHKCGTSEMLAEAWRQVLTKLIEPQLKNEVKRHWQTFVAGWPVESNLLMNDPGVTKMTASYLRL